MKHITPVGALVLLSLPCLLPLGCGTSPGQSQAGLYFVAGIHADTLNEVPYTAKSLWGIARHDAEGLLSGSYSQNRDGVIASGMELGGAPYDILPDGQSSILLPGPHLFNGWTKQDGSLAIGASMQPGQPPMFLALVELGHGHNTTQLAGAWHICVWIGGLEGAPSTLWGSVTLDTSGNGTASVMGNQGGSIDGPVDRPVTISVLQNGQFTLTLDGNKNMAGAIHADGDVLLGAGNILNEVPPEAPFFAALVRKATSASAATFAGAYHIVGLEQTPSGYISVTGSAVPQMGNEFETTFTKNRDGTLEPPPGTDTSDYSVAPDGTFIASPMNGSLVGGISASGDVVVLSGRADEPELPSFYLLLRR